MYGDRPRVLGSLTPGREYYLIHICRSVNVVGELVNCAREDLDVHYKSTSSCYYHPIFMLAPHVDCPALGKRPVLALRV